MLLPDPRKHFLLDITEVPFQVSQSGSFALLSPWGLQPSLEGRACRDGTQQSVGFPPQIVEAEKKLFNF